MLGAVRRICASAGVGRAERVLPHASLVGRDTSPRVLALHHAPVLMPLDSRRSVAGTGYLTFPLIDEEGASAFRIRPPTQRQAYLRVRLTLLRSIRSSPQCAAAPARPRCRSSGCASPRAACGRLQRRLHGAYRAVSELSARVWIAQARQRWSAAVAQPRSRQERAARRRLRHIVIYVCGAVALARVWRRVCHDKGIAVEWPEPLGWCLCSVRDVCRVWCREYRLLRLRNRPKSVLE